MNATPLLERIFAKGDSTQVTIAGTYAWMATVAPVATNGSAPWTGKVGAAAALAVLFGGPAATRKWKDRGRPFGLAIFVGGCAATWLLAPSVVRPLTADPLRAFAGMLGWGMFAVASAGPALGGRREPMRLIDGAPLVARRRVAGGGAGYLAGGMALAVAAQAFGWGAGSVERALLLRLVAIAAGLAIIGVSAKAALAWHEPPGERPRWRLRRGPALIVLGLVALVAMLLVARD